MDRFVIGGVAAAMEKRERRSTLKISLDVDLERMESIMKATLSKTEHKNLGKPDEVRTFPNGKAEVIQIGDGTVGRLTLQPGWRWSRDVKPIAGTELCEAPHFQYHISGRLAVRMQDGTEFELGPGEVSCLGAGHDAWVVGSEPVIVVDWFGATHYAKGK